MTICRIPAPRPVCLLKAVLAAAFAVTLLPTATAGTLDKIRLTGSVTMGVRESSGPLSYALGDGSYGGYHVEICQRALADIQQQLGMARLDIRYQPVTSQNRIPLVQNGSIDIECGSTTNTASRQRDVAFAVTTFVEEVRFAVRADSGIRSFGQLAGRKVVTTTGTTAVQTVRKNERTRGISFETVYGKDHAHSFRLLETGRADAFVMDGALLAGMISMGPSPADYRIVGEVLSVEPIAIMLRKDDDAFRLAVDDSIRALMKSGEIARLWDKWFMQPIPPGRTTVGLPPSESTRAAWAEPNSRPMEAYPPR
ncbi:amino acid ABC transporter substrate-binding protein [Piscinibacter sakaiensis]|uniref:amino acid ABC transporter substrate-binding protein n=1 Tax=Piscinibacter sakaiensis TaxID=1547922 RepID=UPI003AAFD219